MSAAFAGWEIRDPDFVAEIEQTESIELRLSGSADISTRERLEALIQRLHGQLEADGASAVRVDLRQLEFMSAASFTALVSWLSLVHELPPERRYRIRFQSNPLIRWQRRSLGTLSCFATDVVAIDT
jgi:hypothetical protein